MNKNTASLHNCRIYVTLFPCNECAKLIIQARLAEVTAPSYFYFVLPLVCSLFHFGWAMRGACRIPFILSACCVLSLDVRGHPRLRDGSTQWHRPCLPPLHSAARIPFPSSTSAH